MSELTKQQKASEKLDAMYAGIPKKEEQQRFLAEKIVEYLKSRIAEDEGLAEDILKAGKDWSGCNSYLFSQAKAAAKGGRGFYAEGGTILEWAEDYFRSNTKATGKAPALAKKASGKVKAAKPKDSKSDMGKATEKAAATPEEHEPDILAKPKTHKTPKRTKKQTDEEIGQMTIFDLLGGVNG
jgi:hypothetical protein